MQRKKVNLKCQIEEEKKLRKISGFLFFLSRPLFRLLLFGLILGDLLHQFQGGEDMGHEKTGCQAPPEGPILCVNNCGFFGIAATMNMCSKCHKDLILKQEQAKLAMSSIDNIMNASSTSSVTDTVVATGINVQTSVEPKSITVQPSCASGSGESTEANPKEGQNRCNSCKKRVGLTGFKCRCGNLFCTAHRYSDNHDCPFDYRTAARDAIAKANPVIKAEKLDKI